MVSVHITRCPFIQILEISPFPFGGELWQFKALPNGFSSAPRIFTTVEQYLQTAGHTVWAYLHGTIIVGKSKHKAVLAVAATTELLTELGFIIHPEKSLLEPCQGIEFLGFKLDIIVIEMTVTLPDQKGSEIMEVCMHYMTAINLQYEKWLELSGK